MDIFKKYNEPQKTAKFRAALIELRGLKCENCGLTTWLKQPIHLELHHIDGDKSNNTLENLLLLCPNCHSYTDNYGSKNKKSVFISDEELLEELKKSKSIRSALLSLGMSDAGANYNRARKLLKENEANIAKEEKPKENYCIDCGKPILLTSTRCTECAHKASRIIERPTRDELKRLIRIMPFTKIGEKYQVTDNAVRKWCTSYDLPSRVKEIKNITDEDWEKI